MIMKIKSLKYDDKKNLEELWSQNNIVKEPNL